MSFGNESCIPIMTAFGTTGFSKILFVISIQRTRSNRASVIWKRMDKCAIQH
jgi:hypothetical protein